MFPTEDEIQIDLYQIIRHRALSGDRFDMTSTLKKYVTMNAHRGWTEVQISEAMNQLLEAGVIKPVIVVRKASYGSNEYLSYCYADINDADRALST